MAILVSEAQLKLEERLKDISDVTPAQMLSMSNDLNLLMYEEAIAQDHSRYVDSQSYSISTSPSTQALPVDLNSFNFTDCGFFVLDSSGNITGEILTLTGYGSKNRGYYLDAGNVVFTGLENISVVLRYVPEIPELDSVDDSFFIPDRYLSAVIQGLVAMYYRYEEDEERESIAWQKFDPLFSKFLDTLKRGSKILLIPNFDSGY